MFDRPKNQPNGNESQFSNVNNSNKLNQVNPFILQQQASKNGNPHSQSFSINQFSNSNHRFESLNQNCINMNAQNQEKSFEKKNMMGHYNTEGSSNPLNRIPIQFQQKIEPIAINNYPNNQLPSNQEKSHNSFQFFNNKVCGSSINQNQLIPTRQQNQPTSNFKISTNIPKINSGLIEIDYKKQTLNNQLNVSNPPAFIDEGLFQRQITTPREKPQETVLQIDEQLFRRQNQVKQKTAEKVIEKISDNASQQLQINTIFKTKIINCFYCKMPINSIQIGLNCQHFYHKECYDEIISSQIKAGKTLCHCACNQKIPQKQLLQNLIDKTMRNQFLNNQHLYIREQYKIQISQST